MDSPWRLRRGACATLVCLLVSGCAVGSSHPSGGSQSGSSAKKNGVALNLIAPTSGATVGVRAIDVVGTVAPATAVVNVAGHPTTVSRGTFKRVLQLSASTTTIAVTAQAPGYSPSTLQTVVRYSPRLAVALVAAHRAVWTMPPAPTVQAAAHPASAPQPSLPTSGLAAAGSSASVAAAMTGVSTAGGRGTASGSAPVSSVSPAATPSTSASPSSGPPSTPTPEPAPAAGPAPTSNPGTPTAEIRQAYLDECRKAAGGQPASPYCTCMYNHLLSAGALSGRASIESMERALKDFDRTHDISKLPAYLRTAQATCVSKMPVPKLPVAGLPRLQHPAVPGPSAG